MDILFKHIKSHGRLLFHSLLFGISLIPVIPARVSGQALPDAGAIQQQIEREHQLSLPSKGGIERPATPTIAQPPTGATITVTRFRLAGNTLLQSEQLLPALADFLNRPMDFAGLQKAAAAVANVYREAGWVVRAYLPRQEITGGEITIQIIESVFGEIHSEGPEPSRYSSSRIFDMIRAQQKIGEPLNANALDRALLLASDLPGVTVDGSLKEGNRAGETDLVVKFHDKPLFVGEVSVDNAGARSTGRGRVTGNLNLYSPFGVGDLISTSFIHTKNLNRQSADGSSYGRLAATLPIGLDGWRLGANASYMTYKLIAPEFSTLDAHGSSTIFGFDSNYPFIRSKKLNVFLTTNLDHKTFDNYANGSVTSRYSADTLTIGAYSNLFDDIGGGGANSLSLMLVYGHLNLDGSPNEAADAATIRSAGDYTKLRLSLSRQQEITKSLSLYGSYTGQWTAKNLDSSEKLYLGGSMGIRAYPTNEGGGSDAHLLNLEVRQQLMKGFTLIGFFDYGRIKVNHDNGFSEGASLNRYALKGNGLSVVWQSDFGLNSQATWSRRIGSNPNPTEAGFDQDGSLIRDRFWLSVSFDF